MFTPFLQGAYFDSTLLTLAKWPQSSLPTTVSIVQDPFDPNTDQRQAFAQPIVFFRLNPYLSTLLQSASLSLKHLRLRLPARPVARSLCAGLGHDPFDLPLDTTSLELLDLSTCGVLDGEVDTLLVRFTNLKHLILDECPISTRGEPRDGEWSALGKRCALIGLRRARERERELKVMYEARDREPLEHIGTDPAAETVDPNTGARRVRRGRRGLANSTISLRKSSQPSTSSNQQGSSRGSSVRTTKKPKMRILPPLPSLLSISTTLSPQMSTHNHSLIRAEFEAGWAEGVAHLAVTRARLRISASNGVHVVRFRQHYAADDDDDSFEDGLEDLEFVDKNDDESFKVTIEALRTPILCLARNNIEADHLEGCGHFIGQDIWKENL